jgi:xylulokinase
MFILSVDFGTSSSKIAVLDCVSLNPVQTVTKEYPHNVIGEERYEIDAELVFNAAIEGIKELDSTYRDRIGAIAFAVFSPSLMLLDRDGDPLYPCIFYLDKRSRKQSQMIIDVFGKEEFQRITGVLPFAGGVTITSLLWVKENLPEIYANTYLFGHLNTYICHKLTGKWAIDPVNASMTGLYETTKQGGWSHAICDAFDINAEKLPPIIEAGKIMGGLKTEIARELGIRQGVPVMLGSNDAATAILGAGIEKEGDILNIAGSNEICTILTEKPIVSDGYYLRNSLYENKWQIFSINIGGFAIEWFRKQFYQEMDKKYFYTKHLTGLAERRFAQFYQSSSEQFKPYLAGDRHSLEKKQGSFTGLTLGTTRDDMLLAVLLGVHEPILHNIKVAGEFLDLNKQIVVTGGLSECPYLYIKRQILNGFELKFQRRSTTTGNGKLALRGLEMGNS